MSNTLPSVNPCDDNCDCPETPAQTKCYKVREAIPVCASTESAEKLSPSSDCTRLDNTYDELLQAAVVPSVGQTTLLSVCGSSVYTVGTWVQFADGSAGGAIFQIVAIDTVNNFLTVRNACADGESQIKTNPAPGTAIPTGSRFTVVGEPACTGTAEDVANLQETIALAEQLCLDNIASKSINQEEQRLLGTNILSECDEGEVRPCMRHLLTREAKDGSLILGALNEDASGANNLSPLFATADRKVVTAGTGIKDGDTHVGRICNGNLSYIKGGVVMKPITLQVLNKDNIPDDIDTFEETVDLTNQLADQPICSGGKSYLMLQGWVRGIGPDLTSESYYMVHVNDKFVFNAGCGTDDSANVSEHGFGGNGTTIVEIPEDNQFTCKIEGFDKAGGARVWGKILELQVIAIAILL